MDNSLHHMDMGHGGMEHGGMEHGGHGGHGGMDMGPKCDMNMLWNTQYVVQWPSPTRLHPKL
ncbi:hypothetical protein FRC12_007680 [Ceratobasidium sp. 428]|nr:hypothetical protein FRC12_007680 [Ceratobasidium sp. 428]